MIRTIKHYIRLYLMQAWFAYRALFAWSTPFSYLSIKFGFPLFTMILFVYMGRFVGLTDPVYIVLGNILLMPSTNGINGLAMTVSNERFFGALSYLLGSPAPRAPLFLGRAFYQVLDGFTTVLMALPIAMVIFHLDPARMNLGLLLFCILMISVTTCGLGFLMGSISLVSRDGDMITMTLELTFYILVGVNFPVDMLPGFLQGIAYGLPMTRGLMAARLAMAGSGWSAAAPLIGGELLVGLVYTILGYALFRILERRSLVTGMLDNV